jgi:hypothetical protein
MKILESLSKSFADHTSVWILAGLLAVSAYFHYQTSQNLSLVCSLAKEAIGITTPTPDNPEMTLKQIEMPSDSNGYSERELWRWQQFDGYQIEDACR